MIYTVRVVRVDTEVSLNCIPLFRFTVQFKNNNKKKKYKDPDKFKKKSVQVIQVDKTTAPNKLDLDQQFSKCMTTHNVFVTCPGYLALHF